MPYAIAQPSGENRPRLYKLKTSGGKTFGVIPDGEMWSSQDVEIRAKEVLVHLGDDPPIGSCYGCWVEPVCERVTFKGWGEVLIYVHKMPDATKQRLIKGFVAALSRVKKLGPQCDWGFSTEVRNPRGIKAGTYKFRPKGIDVLTYFSHEGTDARSTCKVVAHELFHGVWFRHMTASQRAGWIKLYERFVSVKEVSVRDVTTMVKDMRQIASVRDFVHDCEAEEAAAANIYLGWLKKVHDLSIREVQDLIESGSPVPTPNTHLHVSEVDTPITLYSKGSPDEMFCEAGSSYVVGDLSDHLFIKMLKRLRS